MPKTNYCGLIETHVKATCKPASHPGSWWCILYILALILTASGIGFAEEPGSGELTPATEEVAGTEKKNPEITAPKAEEDTGKIYASPALKSEWGTGAHKSYVVPALEIVGLDILINGYDRLAYSNQTENGKKIYSSTFKTFWDNAAHGHWQLDQDNFKMNELLHPYHGSLYFGLARSTGHDFWESFVYTAAGSFLWETAGETTPPSINDMVATGIGGTFFGEALYRMASLVLEEGGENPGFWRELVAAFVSPPTGFNRLAFGDRFKPIFPSHEPAHFWYIGIGPVLNTNLSGHGSSVTINPNEVTADYAISYGLPGKPGYTYTRPFDYFRFEVASLNSTKNPIENVMLHGLLLGKDFGGDSYRGIWGLYGSYDYISPHFFRVSTSAFSLGVTSQKWLSRSVAVQSTFLAGVGYGAGGTTVASGERDYHFGLTPQGLATVRLILGNAAMLEGAWRGYWVSDVWASEKGTEKISRGNVNLLVRIFGRHAVGFQYVASRRDAHYHGLSEIEQRGNTFSIVYTFLRDKNFGAVEWRDTSFKNF
jgi:hypothetical protein